MHIRASNRHSSGSRIVDRMRARREARTPAGERSRRRRSQRSKRARRAPAEDSRASRSHSDGAGPAACRQRRVGSTRRRGRHDRDGRDISSRRAARTLDERRAVLRHAHHAELVAALDRRGHRRRASMICVVDSRACRSTARDASRAACTVTLDGRAVAHLHDAHRRRRRDEPSHAVARESPVEQLAHLGEARRLRPRAQHDAHELEVAPLGRADEAVARRVREAGLDALDARGSGRAARWSPRGVLGLWCGRCSTTLFISTVLRSTGSAMTARPSTDRSRAVECSRLLSPCGSTACVCVEAQLLGLRVHERDVLLLAAGDVDRERLGRVVGRARPA